jgi:NAD(P)H-dependent flavin oxidoreductase YrpB (nitropropane dioxygenase family)
VTTVSVSRAFTGRPARSVRNRLTQELDRPLAWPLQAAAGADLYQAGDPELFPLYAGQGLRLLRGEQPAAEVVEELVRQASELVR